MRRRAPWIALAAVLGVIGVLGAGRFALDMLVMAELVEPPIETDEAVLEQTQRRLESLARELDALPEVPGAVADDADQSGCSVDSGDLFQPAVSKSWTAEDIDDVKRRIEVGLMELGWERLPGFAPPELAELVRDDRVRLRKAVDGWVAQAVLASFDDVVFVEATSEGAKPCRLG